MATMAKEQEILMNNADMIIDTYLAESIMLRVEKLVSMKGEEACAEQIEMVKKIRNITFPYALHVSQKYKKP